MFQLGCVVWVTEMLIQLFYGCSFVTFRQNLAIQAPIIFVLFYLPNLASAKISHYLLINVIALDFSLFVIGPHSAPSVPKGN